MGESTWRNLGAESKFSGKIDQAVTDVDVLFGVDSVDPRQQWTLMGSSLQLNAQPKVPVARLTCSAAGPSGHQMLGRL